MKKVTHFFHKEFNLPCSDDCPSEKITFKLNYNHYFPDNLNHLKNTYHLTDDKVQKLRNDFEVPYLLLMFEKSKYENKNILDEVYAKEFDISLLPHFIESINYSMNIIKGQKDVLNNYGQRVLVNILLGTNFEYCCKALLLSKGYIINKLEDYKYPIKNENISLKVVKSRTFSLQIVWSFIKENKIVQLSKEEITIGNYLSYLRNFQSHTPLLMCSYSTYQPLAVALMEKIKTEADKKTIHDSLK